MGESEEALLQQIDELNMQNDLLKDEIDALKENMAEEINKREDEINQEAQENIDSIQKAADEQIAALTTELERMRNAFQGESSGWEEKTRNGKVFFHNKETGETVKEKPEALVVAEAMAKVHRAQELEEEVERLRQLTGDTEAKARQQQVAMHENKTELMNLRKLQRAWKDAAAQMFENMNAMDAQAAGTIAQLSAKVAELEKHIENAQLATKQVQATDDQVKAIKEEMREKDRQIVDLTSKCRHMADELRTTKERNHVLQTRMDEEVESLVAPMREEVDKSMGLYAKEKAARNEDRRALADLWPDGWLVPSMLAPFRTITEEEKRRKRREVQAIDAERALRAEIRAQVAESKKWFENKDEYGRKYYEHSDTGEVAWEKPTQMLYEPPPGRDELGNPVDEEGGDGQKKGTKKKKQSSAERKLLVDAAWEQQDDGFGGTLYRNSVTNEERQDRPKELDEALETLKRQELQKQRRDLCASARNIVMYLKDKTEEQRKQAHVLDADEVVYDIYALEELAAGDDNWSYEPAISASAASGGDAGQEETKANGANNGEPVMGLFEEDLSALSAEQLRKRLYDSTKVEVELERDLEAKRVELRKLAQNLYMKLGLVRTRDVADEELARQGDEPPLYLTWLHAEKKRIEDEQNVERRIERHQQTREEQYQAFIEAEIAKAEADIAHKEELRRQAEEEEARKRAEEAAAAAAAERAAQGEASEGEEDPGSGRKMGSFFQKGNKKTPEELELERLQKQREKEAKKKEKEAKREAKRKAKEEAKMKKKKKGKKKKDEAADADTSTATATATTAPGADTATSGAGASESGGDDAKAESASKATDSAADAAPAKDNQDTPEQTGGDTAASKPAEPEGDRGALESKGDDAAKATDGDEAKAPQPDARTSAPGRSSSFLLGRAKSKSSMSHMDGADTTDAKGTPDDDAAAETAAGPAADGGLAEGSAGGLGQDSVASGDTAGALAVAQRQLGRSLTLQEEEAIRNKRKLEAEEEERKRIEAARRNPYTGLVELVKCAVADTPEASYRIKCLAHYALLCGMMGEEVSIDHVAHVVDNVIGAKISTTDDDNLQDDDWATNGFFLSMDRAEADALAEAVRLGRRSVQDTQVKQNIEETGAGAMAVTASNTALDEMSCTSSVRKHAERKSFADGQWRHRRDIARAAAEGAEVEYNSQVNQWADQRQSNTPTLEDNEATPPSPSAGAAAGDAAPQTGADGNVVKTEALKTFKRWPPNESHRHGPAANQQYPFSGEGYPDPDGDRRRLKRQERARRAKMDMLLDGRTMEEVLRDVHSDDEDDGEDVGDAAEGSDNDDDDGAATAAHTAPTVGETAAGSANAATAAAASGTGVASTTVSPAETTATATKASQYIGRALEPRRLRSALKYLHTCALHHSGTLKDILVAALDEHEACLEGMQAEIEDFEELMNEAAAQVRAATMNAKRIQVTMPEIEAKLPALRVPMQKPARPPGVESDSLRRVSLDETMNPEYIPEDELEADPNEGAEETKGEEGMGMGDEAGAPADGPPGTPGTAGSQGEGGGTVSDKGSASLASPSASVSAPGSGAGSIDTGSGTPNPSGGLVSSGSSRKDLLRRQSGMSFSGSRQLSSRGGAPSTPEPEPEPIKEPVKLMTVVSFQALVRAIVAGQHDGEHVPLRDHVNPTQMVQLREAVSKRNLALRSEFQQKVEAAGDAGKTYFQAFLEWEEAENRRAAEYAEICSQLRVLNLRVQAFTSTAEWWGEVQRSAESQLSMTMRRRQHVTEAREKFYVLRVNHMAEHGRSRASMESLQLALEDLLTRRERCLKYPEAARNSIEKMQLEGEMARQIALIRIQVAEVREAMVEEGRRRQLLYEEEVAAARQELLRVEIEAKAHRERQQAEAIRTKQRIRVREVLDLVDREKRRIAELDLVGVDALGQDKTKYAPDKKWQTAVIENLEATLEYEQDRLRWTAECETTTLETQRMVVERLTAKWRSQDVAQQDLWTPNAPEIRAEERIARIEDRVNFEVERTLEDSRRANDRALDAETQLELTVRETQATLEAKNGEADSLRFNAEVAIDWLKSRAVEERTDLLERIDVLELNLNDMARETQQAREDLRLRETTFSSKIEEQVGYIRMLQYELESERAQREMLADENIQLIWKLRTETDLLRNQLRAERAHSGRLLLWICAVRGDVRWYKSHIRYLKGEIDEVRKRTEEEKKALRKRTWEERMSILRMSTDVNALFDFFVTRVACLAGSRKVINDALRQNGAIPVLSAMALSPKLHVRRLAVQAIAGLGWDSFLEKRVIYFAAMFQWNAWKKRVVEEENARLEALNRDFDKSVMPESSPVSLDQESAEEAAKAAWEEEIRSKASKQDDASDPSNAEPSQEIFDLSSSMPLRELIRQRRQWALRATRRQEGPNKMNQNLIGADRTTVHGLIRLCKESEDWQIVRDATLALSIASYDERNHAPMGEDIHCVRSMVQLCQHDDREIACHAAITLANLAYGSEKNQAVIGEQGGVTALLDLCRRSTKFVNALEAGTIGLVNLLCFHELNASRLAMAGGIRELAKCINMPASTNLLDEDQVDEIHANAAEALANATRCLTTEVAHKVHDLGVESLILLCGSENLQVRRHAPLILGNVSQADEHRVRLGAEGAIEGLCALLEAQDEVVQANALWALGNLAWQPMNQERIGRFAGKLVALARSEWVPVRTHAMICIANSLYYNERNRERVLDCDGAAQLFLNMIANTNEEIAVVEAALRALVSLTYLDDVSLILGSNTPIIADLLMRCHPPHTTVPLQRFSLQVLTNLCAHNSNKLRILDSNGTNTLVQLRGSDIHGLRDAASEVLAYLEDITPLEVLMRRKLMSVDDVLLLARNKQDAMVRGVGLEALAEKSWQAAGHQQELVQKNALDTVLDVIKNHEEEHAKLLIPALWAVRNLCQGEGAEVEQVRRRFGACQGIETVLAIARRATEQAFPEEWGAAMLEACLTALVTGVNKHQDNSRLLLRLGTEFLLEIAQFKVATAAATTAGLGDRSSDRFETEAGPNFPRFVVTDSNCSLAEALLQILGPYKNLICARCRASEPGGSTCKICGHPLVDKDDPAAQSMASSKSGSRRALGKSSGKRSPRKKRMRHSATMSSNGNDNNNNNDTLGPASTAMRERRLLTASGAS